MRREYQRTINKKKVYRLCKELGILKQQRQIKPKYPRNLARNRDITAPNQLWEVDIEYGYIHGEDRSSSYCHTSTCLTARLWIYHIGLRCEATDAVDTLKRALWNRRLLEEVELPIIRSDNGPQFISLDFESTCEQLGIEHERIPPRTQNMNAHIEPFHRLLEDDCLSRFEFESYAQAYKAVMEFMDYYNNRRLY